MDAGWFVPYPVRAALTFIRSLKYIREGIACIRRRKIEVPLLDATAIGVSVLRGDFDTAGSVMFLLGVGEILEEWTHKKSVGRPGAEHVAEHQEGMAEERGPGSPCQMRQRSARVMWLSSIWEM